MIFNDFCYYRVLSDMIHSSGRAKALTMTIAMDETEV